MLEQTRCAYCNNRPVTTIPVADGSAGRVCSRHAEEFWRGVVRPAAALRQLDRLMDDDKEVEAAA